MDHFSWDLSELGEYYMEYERLTEHWRTVLSANYIEVSYEELVANQERETRRLIEFQSLPWDIQCLAFHEAKRRIKTNPTQVRKTLYKSSVDRWKRYELWLEPLRTHLAPLIDQPSVAGRSI